jgi:hypothetical protein
MALRMPNPWGGTRVALVMLVVHVRLPEGY